MNALTVAKDVGGTTTEIRIVSASGEIQKTVSVTSKGEPTEEMDVDKMLTNGDPPKLMLWGSDD